VSPGSWRREIVRLIGAIALFGLVALWGASAIGLPLGAIGIALPATAVRLDEPIPPITREASIQVGGVTRTPATVTAYVDRARIDTILVGPDGRYAFRLPVTRLGSHRVRIEVRYAHPRIDELLETTIRRVPQEVPTPQIVTVEPWDAQGGFYVLLRATPGTTISGSAEIVEALNADKVDESGRAEYFVKPASDGLPTLTATDEAGVASAPTEPLDLALLAESQPAVPAAERVEANVSFSIDGRNVTRTQIVRLDKNRIELAQLTRGSIGADTFISQVAGPAGLVPVGEDGCLVNSVQHGRADIVVDEDALVTLVDAFPGLLTAWNGYSDNPRISLCFPEGMPARRDTGSIEIRLRDYVFASVSVPPASASIERLDSGDLERVYRWDRIPFAGRIDLGFAAEAPSLISLLPPLPSLAGAEEDEGVGRFGAALLDGFVRSAGILLLLWVVTSPVGRALGTRRGVLRNVLVVALALGLIPAFRALVPLAIGIGNVAPFADIATALGVASTVVAMWALTAVVAAAAIAARLALGSSFARSRLRPDLWASISLAVAVAAVGVLGLSILSWAVWWLLDLRVAPPERVRLGAWIVGAAGLAVALIYVGRALVELRGRAPDPGLSAIRMLSTVIWAPLIAALMAVPAGVDARIATSQDGAAGFIESTTAGLAILVAYSMPLLVLVAVVAAVRSAWWSTAWFSIHENPRPPSGQRWLPKPVAGQVVPAVAWVTFAGFAIGAAGIGPASVILALALFGLLLRPTHDSDNLATAGVVAQERRGTLLGQALGRPIGAPDGATLETPEARWWDDVRAASLWSSVRFALWVGLVLQLPLLVLYVAQYPLAGVTREDPFYLQRPLLNLATFVASWLFVGLVFGLAYEYFHGTSGLRKGLVVGAAILAATVPIQFLNGITSTFSPLVVTVWVFEVIAFTTLLGAMFDVRVLRREGRLDLARPREALRELGVISGLPEVVTGAGVLLTTVVATILALLSGQVTQVVTRALTPFLLLPPT